MRKIWVAGFLGACIFSGCAGAHHATDGELADLYLSTLDDKHFAWCTADLDQCQKDIDKWQQTERGRVILREHEKEQTGKIHHAYEFTDAVEIGHVSATPTKYGPDLFPKNDTQNHTHRNAVP
ncbi:hypothetical protein [Nitrospira sp. M1]